MDQPNKKKKKHTTLIILSVFLLLLVGVGFYLYSNLNKLLSNALLESFNKNVISDVYELKFESLKVDPFNGNIKVKNVSFEPRKQPLNSYPYINSSFILKTRNLKLMNVQLITLIKDNNLQLQEIVIDKPEVDLTLDGEVNIFFPRKDTTDVQKDKTKKKFLDYYSLTEFRLLHASFNAVNNFNGGNFKIKDFNIALSDIIINQQSLHSEYYYKNFDMFIGEVDGNIKRGPFSRIIFKDFHLAVDSFKVDKTLDTLVYKFDDCRFGIRSVDLNTSDSSLHIQMNAFDLSYKNHSVIAEGIILKPNKTFAELQRDYKFRKTDVSISAGKLKIADIDYDGFLRKRFFVGKLMLDSVDVTVYKDNTKLMDEEKLPGYPGQQIAKIPLPMRVDTLELTNVRLQSIERKKDGTPAIVNLSKGEVHAYNITNQKPNEELTVEAEALLADKVKFEMKLGFSYAKPQITLKGHLGRFNLPDLNKVLRAYTPAKIDSGIADDISFSGVITHTQSSGTMKFLYHGLVIDLQLKDQAKWKSAVVAFAANEYLSENNPPDSSSPAKIVKYNIARDMRKSFVNIIIKSAIAGLKETMLLSGENKKAYKAKKKAMKEKEK
jgi:hypothetical protein